MTASPQIRTAVEACKRDRKLAALLRLIQNGYVLADEDARYIDSELTINSGRAFRDASLAIQTLKFKARFRLAYLAKRRRASNKIDDSALDSVLTRFRTMPDGELFARTAAETLAAGRGPKAVNELVRRWQRRDSRNVL